MTRIIGINGFKRSGKGEVGNAIANIGLDRTLHVQQVGFADRLKILGARTLGFTKGYTDSHRIALMDEAKERWLIEVLREFDEDEKAQWGSSHYKFHGLTGRQFLQNLGNDAREVFGEDFWVDQLLPRHGDDAAWAKKEVARRYPNVDILAITDLRYENEAQRVLDLGGEVWRVDRPGTASDGHASETPLPNDLVTYVIHNDADLTELRYRVERALGV
jgi:hypothetical protein